MIKISVHSFYDLFFEITMYNIVSHSDDVNFGRPKIHHVEFFEIPSNFVRYNYVFLGN